MLAWDMNGKPLLPDHGHPVSRQVAPPLQQHHIQPGSCSLHLAHHQMLCHSAYQITVYLRKRRLAASGVEDQYVFADGSIILHYTSTHHAAQGLCLCPTETCVFPAQ